MNKKQSERIRQKLENKKPDEGGPGNFFSGLRPESTYFPDAARPAKTYFLATAAEKFYTTLGHKQRMTQTAVYHPRLRPGR